MASLSTEERERLKARLSEAETAYHNLLLGLSHRVLVDFNGARVEYTAANRASLAGYISSLKFQLGECAPGGAPGGPLRPVF